MADLLVKTREKTKKNIFNEEKRPLKNPTTINPEVFTEHYVGKNKNQKNKKNK